MITVVFPHALNWFYETLARAIAEEFNERGQAAVPMSSRDVIRDTNPRDVALVVSLSETLAAAVFHGEGEALRQRLLRFKTRILVNCDCVSTHWFEKHFAFGETFFSAIFDIGMIRQTEADSLLGIPYVWIPEALTTAQRADLTPREAARPLPWSIIGHETPDRAAFIAAAVQTLPPGGFVYAPKLRPFNSTSGLDQTAMARVLTKTGFFVWGSHHHHRYHECLRALHSVEAGAVPVKIDPLYHAEFDLPWVYASLSAFRASDAFHNPDHAYRVARDRVLANETLGAHLMAGLAGIGLAARKAIAHA